MTAQPMTSCFENKPKTFRSYRLLFNLLMIPKDYIKDQNTRKYN